ncbi:tryptophan 2,3-dioxygenase family protein [Actinoplanes sp. NPDC051494]|uniref:tryptophan 2,3-dioxygenase family protein n=1 Tax=Actinoplanes sp. NPDC051494 TaxID=3363907 RepID=UPI003789C9A7
MSPAEAAVRAWTIRGGDFPYAEVLDAYREVGKHWVPRSLLEALAGARPGARGQVRLLLDVLLDKFDGRYDYRSYLALPLLEPDDAGHLIADLVRHELHDPPGSLPPGAEAVAKRVRHARRVIERHDLPAMTEARRFRLRASMLPVDTVHDEYLFIRVLQAFELTFARITDELRATIRGRREGGDAAVHLRHATALLREMSPLWSVLATMQVKAFQHFRQYTEGASAIQSRHYKLMESLARRPDPGRLDSAAYLSVPDVLAEVLAGQTTVQDSYGEQTPAMTEFAAAVTRWRRTHHRLAVRMLGPGRTGTGYTEGTPYLERTRSIPIFGSTPQ